MDQGLSARVDWMMKTLMSSDFEKSAIRDILSQDPKQRNIEEFATRQFQYLEAKKEEIILKEADLLFEKLPAYEEKPGF